MWLGKDSLHVAKFGNIFRHRRWNICIIRCEQQCLLAHRRWFAFIDNRGSCLQRWTEFRQNCGCTRAKFHRTDYWFFQCYQLAFCSGPSAWLFWMGCSHKRYECKLSIVFNVLSRNDVPTRLSIYESGTAALLDYLYLLYLLNISFNFFGSKMFILSSPFLIMLECATSLPAKMCFVYWNGIFTYLTVFLAFLIVLRICSCSASFGQLQDKKKTALVRQSWVDRIRMFCPRFLHPLSHANIYFSSGHSANCMRTLHTYSYTLQLPKVLVEFRRLQKFPDNL